MASELPSIYTVKELSFSYEGFPPLFDRFDLDISEGIVTTIIGPNGSGKSTLLKLLSKNLKPSGGTILLRAGHLSDLRLSDFARLVATVHQSNRAPFDMTLERLVRLGRHPHRLGMKRFQAAAAEADERAIARALELTELQGMEHRRLASLSDGQQQRAWIAMALAQDTKVLLLDEPTSFLDIRYQLELLALIRRLNEEYGLTVIMVLHDINQAIHYSDELVALASGKLIAQGLPQQVARPEVLEQLFGLSLDTVEVKGQPYVLTV